MWRSRMICSLLLASLSLILASEPARRAPSGFQGVRGKKSIQDTYPGLQPSSETADNTRLVNHMEDIPLTNLHLRNSAASKNLESFAGAPESPLETLNSITPIEQSLSSNMLEKRAPSAGFHGMRGKKLFYPEGNFNQLEQLDGSDFWQLPKRAPKGFMGMRGKKEMEFVNDELEQDKRAPMGFMGMRGKKDDDDDEGFSDYYMDKRAPNMGFVGMRGKKFPSFSFAGEKRAPADGFFGMRGKKQPARSSFFGMRGKKYPYEFRGKFVGVRGKKDETSMENNLLEDTDIPSDGYVNDLDLNELMVLLADRNMGSWEKRKGPSGFMGMRG